MPADFSISNYVNKTFRMYEGKEQTIILECPNRLMKSLIDRFGEEFEVARITEETFQAAVTASISKTFFGWLFTYAGEIKLVGPKEVVEEYEEQIRKAMEIQNFGQKEKP